LVLVTGGEKLGPYEILALIGAGGMGEVWTARDTRLDRIVAIKFSKEQFSEHFEREAHAIAALNHPHICQLYDVGALPSGAGYLVMEYVEGHPVVSSTKPGPLPFDLALKLGIQMADALSAAHSKGIVHRDLKPANVLMTKSGIKILDFGLAKIEQPGRVRALAGLPPEQVPTEEMWEAGAIVGTLQYTSPEQLQGKTTDARSDIFSFGVLLYEMLTGRPAFQADNAASLIAAVLKSPTLAVMAVSPPALSRILNRCLAADPDDRWQSARDLQVNLEWVALGLPETAPAPRGVTASRKWWIGAAAAIVLAAALGASVMYWLRPVTVGRTVKLAVLPPEGATFVPGTIAGPPALSPDGRTIAFVAEEAGEQLLWLRALDSLSARELPGTEGARYPFWSPDSRSLGFFSADKLKRIDVNGGDAQALASVPGGFNASGVWGADDKILYAPSNLQSLFVMAATGGQPTPATRLETQDIGHFWPAILPDGEHFLYGSQAGTQIFVATMGSFGRSTLLSGATRPVYVPAHGAWPESLLYVRENTLTMQLFDSSPPAVRGEPRAVAEGVTPFDFSVSAEGTLAYRSEGIGGPELVTFDRSGNRIGSLGKQAGPTGAMRFSPDGKTVAVVHAAGKAQDLWLHDLGRGVTSRFTFNGGNNPVWSPDGSWIVFRKAGGLYVKASNGAGMEQPIYTDREDPGLRNATDWSQDGHFLLVARTDPKTGFDMWLLPDPLSKGQHKLMPLLVSPVNEGQGRFANGPGAPRWVVYNSEESGTNELYVITMPGAVPGKWQISSGGGYAPRWAREGRELYFIGPDLRTVMEVDVEPGPVFRPGQPHALFKLPSQINGATNDQSFAVSPDGKTFLVAVPAQSAATSGINVVLNWQAEMPK
jgi:Tol biopolymer transport system component